jgi:hypothetical protein
MHNWEMGRVGRGRQEVQRRAWGRVAIQALQGRAVQRYKQGRDKGLLVLQVQLKEGVGLGV